MAQQNQFALRKFMVGLVLFLLSVIFYSFADVRLSLSLSLSLSLHSLSLSTLSAPLIFSPLSLSPLSLSLSLSLSLLDRSTSRRCALAPHFVSWQPHLRRCCRHAPLVPPHAAAVPVAALPSLSPLVRFCRHRRSTISSFQLRSRQRQSSSRAKSTSTSKAWSPSSTYLRWTARCALHRAISLPPISSPAQFLFAVTSPLLPFDCFVTRQSHPPQKTATPICCVSPPTSTVPRTQSAALPTHMRTLAAHPLAATQDDTITGQWHLNGSGDGESFRRTTPASSIDGSSTKRVAPPAPPLPLPPPPPSPPYLPSRTRDTP